MFQCRLTVRTSPIMGLGISALCSVLQSMFYRVRDEVTADMTQQPPTPRLRQTHDDHTMQYRLHDDFHPVAAIDWMLLKQPVIAAMLQMSPCKCLLPKHLTKQEFAQLKSQRCALKRTLS